MIIDLVIGGATGLACGLLFFGGLRWTVSQLATSRRPLLVAGSSFLVRVTLVAVPLALVADGSAVRVVAGLAGILAARTAMVGMVRRQAEPEIGEEVPPWI